MVCYLKIYQVFLWIVRNVINMQANRKRSNLFEFFYCK